MRFGVVDGWERHDGDASLSEVTFSSLEVGNFRTLNTLAAARSLASHAVQERFVQELAALVRSGLRGQRIG